ncbi:MAG TPA: hypothetical protein DIT93_03720 [Pelagibacterium sp.]|nr:hypothetical protein [Pelagibacterium sp.]HCO54110.1 hypothetical protein [Pelagibacterium sp.]|tara:strand:+ start:6057 stop:6848 length:792 start_codon:yes stop_codon:yes gene_type:complete
MSWLERLCITSFIAQGHQFELYSYDCPEVLPEGCKWRDAAEIVPRENIFFYKGDRSPAVFADYFRLMLMVREAGIWVDCDMLCIRPFSGLSSYVFGYEVPPGKQPHAGQINNAVLRLPKDSDLLKALLGIFDGDSEKIDPVWMPWYRRMEIAVRRMLGQRIGLTHMQFGATGPFPLTHFARMLGKDGEAMATTVFYPLPYDEVRTMLDPGSSFERYIHPETLGLHLWRMALTNRSRRPEPQRPFAGSALGEIAGRLGVETDLS